jgi:hypothetical protein
MGSRLVLLAPPNAKPRFGLARSDSRRREQLFKRAAQLRGSIYLADGAIRDEDLSPEGCFWHPLDDSSWHMLMVDDDDEVVATLRLSMHPLDPASRKGGLPHIGKSLDRNSENPWNSRLRAERFLAGLSLAHGQKRPKFFIVGGWAADPAGGAGHAGAELALSVWAITRHTDAAGALCIATERHDAHGQLVRTGARPIPAVAKQEMYFDSDYGCKVGLLGFSVFDERRSLRRIVDHLFERLSTAEILLCD